MLLILEMWSPFLLLMLFFCSVIPLKDSPTGALKNAALKPIQAEDNVYIIDDYH